MFDRMLVPPKQSFFLFGPRGTGKSTLLKNQYSPREGLTIDLLDPLEEDAFQNDPSELERRVLALPPGKNLIIIDEIQKIPRLLDGVHRLIEQKKRRFVMTGSSARKLKRGASNLLAGRAFVLHLHPLTNWELGGKFDLSRALKWGTLPRLYQLDSDQERILFLRSYALTYLKEEIAAEQAVRRLNPFRQFLEVAAQCNGQILNYSRIADDVGVDTKTVQSYFLILEDTLVGFFLPAYHRSLRKQQRLSPKFYFFDTGVKRALDRSLGQDLYPRTYGFGAAFEHLVVLELRRLNDYLGLDWKFYYLRTKGNVEIDLVIDRPGQPTAVVEIKSTEKLTPRDLSELSRFVPDFKDGEMYCFSLDPHPKVIGSVTCLPWREGCRRLLPTRLQNRLP